MEPAFSAGSNQTYRRRRDAISVIVIVIIVIATIIDQCQLAPQLTTRKVGGVEIDIDVAGGEFVHKRKEIKAFKRADKIVCESREAYRVTTNARTQIKDDRSICSSLSQMQMRHRERLIKTPESNFDRQFLGIPRDNARAAGTIGQDRFRLHLLPR